MKLLTLNARLVCKHLTGVVKVIVSQQDFVCIAGQPVLVEGDSTFRFIVGCPNRGATIKPCALTTGVESGLSTFIHIQGRSVCLDTLTGLTDGTPPGTIHYVVEYPGQDFVSEES